MTSEPFLLCCLNHEFHTNYRKYLIKELFPKELLPLYDTIVNAHSKYKKDITVEELRALHLSKHPTLTQANIANLDIIFNKLKDIPAYDPAIAEDVLKQTYLQHKAQCLAEAAINIADNKKHDFNKLRELTQEINDFAIRQDNEYVPTSVTALIERSKNSRKWSWCLAPLQEILGNIGEADFIIVAARPDAGKTGFHVNFTWNQGGWLEQGAKVHVFANEEHADNHMKRGLTCFCGVDWDTICLYPDHTQKKIAHIENNIFIKDAVGVTMDDLHAYCKEHQGNLDILIIDQLDKIAIKGDFSRTDEKLSAIYVQARELGKRYKCAVIGITQASMEAHDKLYYGFECLAGSKTGKAAEADVVITIGMKSIESTQGTDSGLRVINLSKNKLTGIKTPIQYMLDHKLSRMKP